MTTPPRRPLAEVLTDATAEDLRARLAIYDGVDTAYVNTMRRLYTGALELIESETAEAVTTDA